jgi:small-conductance mechanosensitive channel
MENLIVNIIESLAPYMGLLNLVIVMIISFIIFSIFLQLIKRYLLKRVRRKKQITNIITFLDLLKFLFILFLIIVAVSAYHGNWGEIGFIAGLLTIAVGWALQKPISGVVAWLIIISRRPFKIGDRVIISNVKGEISNISMTHIFFDEVGGTILGEEKSGRTVMIPTSIIFEQEVVNYTHRDNYILDEVTTAITYESKLDKAEKIILFAVEITMSPMWEKFPKRIEKKPHIRLKMKDSGIDVTVRYNTFADRRNAISTDIIREILRQISKTKDVEIAYPHTQILLPENKNLP